YVNWSAGWLIAEVPAVFVTVTSTVPALCAGELTEIEVGELTTTPVPFVAPNATVEPVVKPVPVTTTVVPPTVEPKPGAMPVTVGVTAVYAYWSFADVGDVPAAVVTVMSTVPTVIVAGAVAEIVLSFVTENAAVVEPNLTAVAPVNAE